MHKLTLLFFLFVLSFTRLPSLTIEGITTAGMQFRGDAKDFSHQNLHLQMKGETIGIPLQRIRNLSLAATSHSQSDLLLQLEQTPGILDLLDDKSLHLVGQLVLRLSDSAEWPELYKWSTRLLETSLSAEARQSTLLWKAWALHEMKLFQESTEILMQIDDKWDALVSPVRLCWLMAYLEIRHQNLDRALYWALLPGLQIPPVNGPLADELTELAAFLDSRNPDHTTSIP
jgi:hypothetical protein